MYLNILGISMYKINGLMVVSLLGLSACGGSGGGSSTVVANGVFKDSNVHGLAYKSGNQTGTTDVNGVFKYEEDEDVTFSIGALEIGTGKGKAVMTPLDLVEDGKLATPEVINKARFLMMLDKDNMPSNGIEISKKVQDVAKEWETVDFASEDFPTQEVNRIITEASVEDGVVHELPDADAASSHLRTTLLCANAGAFVGDYEGTENGNVALMVNPVTGEVNGSSFNSENEVSAEISNTTALDYDADLQFVSDDDVGKRYSGMVDSSEKVSGEWSSSLDISEKGNFDLDRLGGASNAVYRYTVAFAGSDKGLFTFDVDKGYNITGTTYSVSTKEESTIKGKLVNDVLTATSDDGTKIDGTLDPDTLSLNGVWSNVGALQAGSYAGAGCRLN